jgi:hypothetical protein
VWNILISKLVLLAFHRIKRERKKQTVQYFFKNRLILSFLGIHLSINSFLASMEYKQNCIAVDQTRQAGPPGARGNVGLKGKGKAIPLQAWTGL